MIDSVLPDVWKVSQEIEWFFSTCLGMKAPKKSPCLVCEDGRNSVFVVCASRFFGILVFMFSLAVYEVCCNSFNPFFFNP